MYLVGFEQTTYGIGFDFTYLDCGLYCDDYKDGSGYGEDYHGLDNGDGYGDSQTMVSENQGDGYGTISARSRRRV